MTSQPTTPQTPYNESAAPTPLTLADGKTILVSPLRDCDVSTLTAWVQEHYIQTAYTGIKEGTPDSVKKMAIEIAQRVAPTLVPYVGTGANLVSSIEGCAMVFWLMARQNDRSLTLEWCRKQLTDMDIGAQNQQKIADKMDRYNDNYKATKQKPPEKDGKKGGLQERKVKRKRR